MAETSGQAGRVHKRKSGVAPVIATLLALAVVASLGVSLLASTHAGVQDQWTTSFLNFGTNPVSHTLQITFSRVSYINQLTQWNTSGFQGATLTGNGSFLANSSGYGVMQFNSTTAKNGVVNYPIAGSLGANVSYFFSNHRVALNGTTAVWYEEISEVAQTTVPATTGNVSAASGGNVQNTVFIKGSYSSGNYTFTAYDTEWQHGGYDTMQSTAFAASVKVAPLTFFNVYFYLAKSQTVVSIVNTVNSTVLGSVTMHPLLDANLTKIADLTDFVSMASSTNAAMILDRYYFADHNTYTSSTATGTQPSVEPAEVGTVGDSEPTPFDPATVTQAGCGGCAAQFNESATSASSGTVNSTLSNYGSVTNSSSPAGETSDLVNSTFIVNASNSGAEATSKQVLSTVRAQGESTGTAGSGTLYVTAWTPAQVTAQVNSFLQTYVSSKTGIAANQIRITGYLIENVTVDTTYSSTAQTAVANYLDSALPGMLNTWHLGLVNTQTGAVDAGADIGQFWDAVTHTAYEPQVTQNGAVQLIYDPVNGHTYAGVAAAGFPSGSFVTAAGAIHVPGQGTFLGFSASGIPEFTGDSCFIICTSSLSGAASAVSSFLGSAASSVSNAVGTVTATISNDVVEPVASGSSTLGQDLTGLTGSLSQAVQNVLPTVGGTLGNVAGSITSALGGVSKSLGSVGSSLGSVASGAAGALTAGVTSFANNVYHLGGSVGSAIYGGANSIVNTIGKTVSTAAGVISPYFAEGANDIVNGVKGGVGALSNLGSSIASAGMSALNTIGGYISKGAAGLYSLASNAWGAITAPFINGATGAITANGSGVMSWVDSLGGSVSTLTIVIIIIAIAIVILVAVWLIFRHRRHKHSGAEKGSSEGHRGGRRRHRGHRASAATWDEQPVVVPGLLA